MYTYMYMYMYIHVHVEIPTYMYIHVMYVCMYSGLLAVAGPVRYYHEVHRTTRSTDVIYRGFRLLKAYRGVLG